MDVIIMRNIFVRLIKELLLVPCFSLMRIVTHHVIIIFSNRGIPPDRFREQWATWIKVEQGLVAQMNTLPSLGKAIPVYSAVFAAVFGYIVLTKSSVNGIVIFLYMLSCLVYAYCYIVITSTKLTHLLLVLPNLPLYCLRVTVGLMTTNSLRLLHILLYMFIAMALLEILKNVLGHTFLFYKFDFEDISLGVVLLILMIKKVIYLLHIVLKWDKLYENTCRMHPKMKITRKRFLIDIIYSFSSGIAISCFNLIFVWLTANIYMAFFPVFDLTTVIGMAVFIVANIYFAYSVSQELHYYTSHKYMHAKPYFNIFHIEHHISICPTALIGFSEAGLLESATYPLWIYGNVPGFSALLICITYTANEALHHYHHFDKKIRQILIHAFNFAPVFQLINHLRVFMFRSKNSGIRPSSYFPNENNQGIDIPPEEERHAEHHWANVPYYGFGLSDYYFGVKSRKKA